MLVSRVNVAELVSPGPAGGDLDDGPAVAADDPGGGVGRQSPETEETSLSGILIL
jgi:hypothetical protein